MNSPLPVARLPDDIQALVATLREAEGRLEELTAGQVDAITDVDGRTFLLRRSQEGARRADAAMRATSWGMGQVLGEYAALGYGEGLAGRTAFGAAQATEAGQVDTIGRYVLARPALLSALRARDWGTVARIYNGNGAVADYSAKLAAAFARA